VVPGAGNGALAAFISVALPEDFFSSFSGLGFLELLVVLAASVPLYMCATGSIPIAAVLLMKGISPGTALVFLMAGDTAGCSPGLMRGAFSLP
jgi:uncharacterized membrane protein YraQ (UPF0718 family)